MLHSGRVVYVLKCATQGCSGVLRKRLEEVKKGYKSQTCQSCRRKKAPYTSAYSGLLADAAKRNYKVDLTFEEYLEFVGSNCFYCNGPVDWMPHHPPNGARVKSSLDRVDSTLGYFKENCVACCTTCNYMKQSFSKEIFIEKCNKIAIKHPIELKDNLV